MRLTQRRNRRLSTPSWVQRGWLVRWLRRTFALPNKSHTFAPYIQVSRRSASTRCGSTTQHSAWLDRDLSDQYSLSAVGCRRAMQRYASARYCSPSHSIFSSLCFIVALLSTTSTALAQPTPRIARITHLCSRHVTVRSSRIARSVVRHPPHSRACATARHPQHLRIHRQLTTTPHAYPHTAPPPPTTRTH